MVDVNADDYDAMGEVRAVVHTVRIFLAPTEMGVVVVNDADWGEGKMFQMKVVRGGCG